MGSATAGLVFVIVVVVIAIVCFRYWLFREEGFKAGFGGCSCLPQSFPPPLWAELCSSSHRVKDWTGHTWVPEQGSCGRIVPLLPQHELGSAQAPAMRSAQLGHLLPLHLGWRDGSAHRPSLCAARRKALWHWLAVLGLGSWQ